MFFHSIYDWNYCKMRSHEYIKISYEVFTGIIFWKYLYAIINYIIMVLTCTIALFEYVQQLNRIKLIIIFNKFKTKFFLP